MTDETAAEEKIPFTSSESLKQSRFSGRSRRVMGVMIGVSVILGFGMMALYAYNKGKQEGQSSVPPVIQPKEGPSKVRPTNPGGMKVPNRDKEVFTRMEPDPPPPRVELLRPRPEKPMEVPSTESSKEQNDQRLKPSRSDLKKKTGYDMQVEKKLGSKKTKSARDGDFRVQIASLRSEKLVRDNWLFLNKRHKDLLGKLSLFVERKDLGGSRGTYYRMQVGPIGTRDAAQLLCGKLKRLKLGCIIVKR